MQKKYRKFTLMLSIALLGSLLTAACGSLLNQMENVVQQSYGPQYSEQERQTRTFEALWTDLQDHYIHHDTTKVDWKSLHDQYTAKIQAGLTNDQFVTSMDQLAKDLPTGALVYQSRSERLDTDTKDLSTYEGIGAIIGFQPQTVPHIVILDVIAGSPAERAGLRPHDSIYKIDGNPILLEEGLSVVDRVRGPAGSTVTLDVKSPGESERTIEVKRGKLASSGKLEAYQIKGAQYGYMLFPPISYSNLTQDVRDSLQTFTSNQKLEGLILDLRVAGSSGNWPLTDMLTLFSNGKIGEYFDSNNKTQALTVKGEDYVSSQTVPLILLIGANTNGSPEILAASLQATKRATLIGQTTAGTVEGSDAFYLPDGSRVYIATASFRLANGTDIGNSGIKPDITIAAGWDEVQPNSDPVLDKAVEILKGQK